MAALFQLSDRQWAAIQPLLPTNQPGAHRVDDRRVISGIIHVLRTGCRWQDTPSDYGPPTTVYNRFHRWSQRGIWQTLFASLVEVTPGGLQLIDSTTSKARRTASGGKGGLPHKPSAGREAARGPRSTPLRMSKAASQLLQSPQVSLVMHALRLACLASYRLEIAASPMAAMIAMA